MHQPVGVLFVYPQYEVMSDSTLYAEMMRSFDPARFRCFVACPEAPASDPRATMNLFRNTPGVTVIPTVFPPIRGAIRDPRRLARFVTAETLPTLGHLFRLYYLIKQHNIRIIHSSEAPFETSYSRLFAYLTGARWVVHFHAIVGAWLSDVSKANMQHADMLVAVSDAARRSLIEIGFAREQTRTVLNGIDLRRWDYQVDGAPVRAELGIPAGVPVITTIARVFPDKGHAEILRALATLRGEVGDFRYLVVGDDDLRSTMDGTSWTKRLKTMAAELGLAKQVIFAGFRQDVERVLAATDIFAMPSRSEALGLVFLEAGAMQRPVIAAATTGVVEAVEHGVTGLLSPYGDIAALATNLRALLNDRALRRQMGEAGRRRVAQRFTREQMTHAIEAVYDELLAAHPYGRLRTN